MIGLPAHTTHTCRTSSPANFRLSPLKRQQRPTRPHSFSPDSTNGSGHRAAAISTTCSSARRASRRLGSRETGSLRRNSRSLNSSNTVIALHSTTLPIFELPSTPSTPFPILLSMSLSQTSSIRSTRSSHAWSRACEPSRTGSEGRATVRCVPTSSHRPRRRCRDSSQTWQTSSPAQVATPSSGLRSPTRSSKRFTRSSTATVAPDEHSCTPYSNDPTLSAASSIRSARSSRQTQMPTSAG